MAENSYSSVFWRLAVKSAYVSETLQFICQKKTFVAPFQYQKQIIAYKILAKILYK